MRSGEMGVCILLVVLVLMTGCSAADMYPYGQDEGDTLFPLTTDNGVSHFVMDQKVKFFTHSYELLHIYNDGILSFGDEFASPIPQEFPLELDVPVAALFWADHDLSVGIGNIWYRASTDSAMIERATNDVSKNFEGCGEYFIPTAVYIVTWENVTHQGVTPFSVCMITEDKVYCTCIHVMGHSEEFCECMREHNNTDFCNCIIIYGCPLVCDCRKMYNDKFCECVFTGLGNYSLDLCNCFRQFPEHDLEFCECFVENEDYMFCDCLQFFGNIKFCECYSIGGFSIPSCQCVASMAFDEFYCKYCYHVQRDPRCGCLDAGFSQEICECHSKWQNLEFCICEDETGGDREYCWCRYDYPRRTEDFCNCMKTFSYDKAFTDFCNCFEEHNDESFCNCYVKYDNFDLCVCLDPVSGHSDPLFCYCMLVKNNSDYCSCFVINYDCDLCECYILYDDYDQCYSKIYTGQTLDALSEMDPTNVRKQLSKDQKFATISEARREAETNDQIIEKKKAQYKDHFGKSIETNPQTIQENRMKSRKEWEQKQAAMGVQRDSGRKISNLDNHGDSEDFEWIQQRAVLEQLYGKQTEEHIYEKNTNNLPEALDSLSHPTQKAGTLLYNTYQAVIITNTWASVVIYNYDKISWLTGDSGGGTNGQGGIMANVGFNKRRGLLGYNHPYSMSTQLFDLVTDSNTGQPGQWMYLVSKNTRLLGPDCELLMEQPR